MKQWTLMQRKSVREWGGEGVEMREMAMDIESDNEASLFSNCPKLDSKTVSALYTVKMEALMN